MTQQPAQGTDNGAPAGVGSEQPPHLDESVRRVGAAGRQTVDAALDTARALRKLVSSDLALARSAIGRALAWSVVAIVFGASAWLTVIGILITGLHALGLNWLAATSIAGLISLAVTALAAWRMMVFFNHAGMHATRRQLSRLGLFQETEDDELDDDTDPPSSTSTGPTQAGTP